MVPPARPAASVAGHGTPRRRRGRPARPALDLPNDINAPAARIHYYKLFLEFMNYKDNASYEYGRLFSE